MKSPRQIKKWGVYFSLIGLMFFYNQCGVDRFKGVEEVVIEGGELISEFNSTGLFEETGKGDYSSVKSFTNPPPFGIEGTYIRLIPVTQFILALIIPYRLTVRFNDQGETSIDPNAGLGGQFPHVLEKQLTCSQVLVVTERNPTDGKFRAQNTFNKITSEIIQCTPGKEDFCNTFEFDCNHGIPLAGGNPGDLDGYFMAGDYTYTSNGDDLQFCLVGGGCGDYTKVPSL